MADGNGADGKAIQESTSKAAVAAAVAAAATSTAAVAVAATVAAAEEVEEAAADEAAAAEAAAAAGAGKTASPQISLRPQHRSPFAASIINGLPGSRAPNDTTTCSNDSSPNFKPPRRLSYDALGVRRASNMDSNLDDLFEIEKDSGGKGGGGGGHHGGGSSSGGHSRGRDLHGLGHGRGRGGHSRGGGGSTNRSTTKWDSSSSSSSSSVSSATLAQQQQQQQKQQRRPSRGGGKDNTTISLTRTTRTTSHREETSYRMNISFEEGSDGATTTFYLQVLTPSSGHSSKWPFVPSRPVEGVPGIVFDYKGRKLMLPQEAANSIIASHVHSAVVTAQQQQQQQQQVSSAVATLRPKSPPKPSPPVWNGNLKVCEVSTEKLSITWSASESTAAAAAAIERDPAVTHYELQYRLGSSSDDSRGSGSGGGGGGGGGGNKKKGNKVSKSSSSLSSTDGWTSCYTGPNSAFVISNLPPGTPVFLRARAMLPALAGVWSDIVETETQVAPPGAPEPPVLTGKKTTSLSLKWTKPSFTGGRDPTRYTLYWDSSLAKDKESNFTVAFAGPERRYRQEELQPMTTYRFYLVAENEAGAGRPSATVCFSTGMAKPQKPQAPFLKLATADTITVGWSVSADADEHTLEMDDPVAGFGFRAQYNGAADEYTISRLRRTSVYRFRLVAKNKQGISPYSEVAELSTGAHEPGPGRRPSLVGRPGTRHLVLEWDKVDDGGAEILDYTLLRDAGQPRADKPRLDMAPVAVGEFAPVWTGSGADDRKAHLEGLDPGVLYHFMVAARNAAGSGPPSAALRASTAPEVPDAPPAPVVVVDSNNSADSQSIVWVAPAVDGGSSITSYELETLCTEDEGGGEWTKVFSGMKTNYLCKHLRPAVMYSYRVAARNRAGLSAFSDPCAATTGAAVPTIPTSLRLVAAAATSITIEWDAPLSNGSPLLETRIEGKAPGEKNFGASISAVTSGAATLHQVTGLVPDNSYTFRLQARNALGAGRYSAVISASTLPACPAAPARVQLRDVTRTSVRVHWCEPASNGSPVTGYLVEVDGGSQQIDLPPEALFADINGLLPSTMVRVRVQAHNAIGDGPFSSTVEARTGALPPPPPTLSLVSATHSSLKVRLLSDAAALDVYESELEVRKGENWVPVYKGKARTHKVTKLAASTTFELRLRDRNAAGLSPYSETVCMATGAAPLAAPPPPKVSPVVGVDSTLCCTIHGVASDTLVELYVLKCTGSTALICRREEDEEEGEGTKGCFEVSSEFVQIWYGPPAKLILGRLAPGDYRLRCRMAASTDDTEALFSATSSVTVQRPAAEIEAEAEAAAAAAAEKAAVQEVKTKSRERRPSKKKEAFVPRAAPKRKQASEMAIALVNVVELKWVVPCTSLAALAFIMVLSACIEIMKALSLMLQ
eukprot:UC1_evm1s1245